MQYIAHVTWKRSVNTPFNPKTYNRTHEISFGGNLSINASSAPEFLGDASLPNPEELFAASISSCFMLTFLYWASTKGITIDEYQATARATLAKNNEGKMAVTEVVIKPTIRFHENKQPDAAVLNDLFKQAHQQCFISSSVKTNIVIDQTS
jgi:organic hydroperoxide reductase OsmC/OhrA